MIFAGEIEVNELEAYEGLLGQDIYANLPLETEKILYEGENSGHGFAAYPNGQVQEYAVNWLKFQILEDLDVCEALLNVPSNASQYLTNIICEESITGDINGDFLVNVQDVILTINIVLNNEYSSSADLNFDNVINILDVVQLVNIILN